MSRAELERFERLLEQSDHDLYAWIIGSTAVPPDFDDELMSDIRAFRPPVGQGG